MRAKIVATRNNRVLVTEDGPLGNRVMTEFFATDGGGYVRVDDGMRYPQVCDGLQRAGNTLWWNGKKPLVDLIRRERRNTIAAERRFLARV